MKPAKTFSETMPIYHDVAQGEAEWLTLRIGRVTASEIHNLVTPLFKVKDGDGPKTYLYTKLAEAYRGKPLPGFSSWATEQGQELEDEARKWYSLEFDEKIKNCGFVESDDHKCGCSPDGLIGDDGGLELKAPEATNHVRYLIDGVAPKDYIAQIHMAMFVTGRPWWKFVSYHRGFPAFALTIQRDEEICAKIGEALAKFYTAYDEAMAKLKAAAQ